MGANWEPKWCQIRVQEAWKQSFKRTQAQHAETTKLEHSTKDFNDFWGPASGLFLGPELLQNLILELLEACLSHPKALGGFPRALGGILERSWRLLECSWSAYQGFPVLLKWLRTCFNALRATPFGQSPGGATSRWDTSLWDKTRPQLS